MKKYILTNTTKEWNGITLHQIKAARDIPEIGVKNGDLGGWLESEKNLDQEGNAWVYGNARVLGNARVSDNAWVYGNAMVSGNTWVYGNAMVSGNARVNGNARVSDNAWVYGNARVSDDACVSDDAWVYGNAMVLGDAMVYGNARVNGNAKIESLNHIFWASMVGSEYGTLTVYTTRDGNIEVTRGSFRGTLDDFEEEVKRKHGDDCRSEEYMVLIQYIRIRFRNVTVTVEDGNYPQIGDSYGD